LYCPFYHFERLQYPNQTFSNKNVLDEEFQNLVDKVHESSVTPAEKIKRFLASNILNNSQRVRLPLHTSDHSQVF